MAIHQRLAYLALVGATIAAGLTVHLTEVLPPTVRDITGDALWAVMIVWCIGVLVPRAPVWARAASAFLICVLVEASQAWQTPSLDAIRHTALGHLVLGSGFDWRDFIAYAAGVAAAVVAERVLRVR